MNVLFSHSYFLKLDSKQLKTAMPYPPLGTLYAAAYLRENGYTVSLFDTMFCDSAKDIQSCIDTLKPDVVVFYDDGFNYLTKMCLTNMREACFDMQRHAKSKGCKVITSSSDSSDRYELYLEQESDVVAIGEAEQTIFELCEAFKHNRDIAQIDGIAYRSENGIVKTHKRTVLKDLAQLPEPAWDLVNIEPYKQMWLQHHGFFSLNFVTTRGCPYKCNWCAKPIYGNRYNSHPAHQIVKQIKKWQKHFGFSHVWFADDLFGLKPGWLAEFTTAVKQEGLIIRYKIQSRADLLVQEDTVRYLSESGCDMVWMGAESGSQKILDAMDKGTTIPQIYEACRLLKSYGVKVALFLQLGYLNETIEDIRKTIQMTEELLPHDIGISVSYPLPGTGFYEKVKSGLHAKSNWTDSDDLDLLFQNTYKKEFYKQLQRYIHRRYRKKIALHSLRELWVRPSAQNIRNTLSLLRLIPVVELERYRLKRIEPHAAASL